MKRITFYDRSDSFGDKIYVTVDTDGGVQLYSHKTREGVSTSITINLDARQVQKLADVFDEALDALTTTEAGQPLWVEE